MARRELEKRNIRNIQRSHGTYYISIPIEKVVVKKRGKSIIIKDWEK